MYVKAVNLSFRFNKLKLFMINADQPLQNTQGHLFLNMDIQINAITHFQRFFSNNEQIITMAVVLAIFCLHLESYA